MDAADLVFVGFNSHVNALNRDTGELVWTWKSPKGTGFVTLLLDEDRLIVSIMGYTYCLNPVNGSVLWFNELKGMGLGVAVLASVRGSAQNLTATAAAVEEQHAAAAAATPHGA